MDPLSALSLASNIIQVVDFSSRIITQSYEIYKSSDGSMAEHAILDDAAKNPSELYDSLDSHNGQFYRKPSVADNLLSQLKRKSAGVVNTLRNALKKARKINTRIKWRSVDQALAGILDKRGIATLAG